MSTNTKYITPVSPEDILMTLGVVKIRLSDPDGWCQNASKVWSPRGIAVDLPGALLDACGGNRSLYAAVRDALMEAGCGNIYEFNDSTRTTHEDVLALLDNGMGVVRVQRQRRRRRRQVLLLVACAVIVLVAAVSWGGQ